jgi:hypothetical protein
MTTGVEWRQITLGSSFRDMPTGSRLNVLRFVKIALLISGSTAPLAAAAQEQWTGVGAIGATAMYMDTTTIIRAGSIRKVWIKSLDSAPKSFVTGKDTLTFDTVIGLNVFDCAKHTRTVEAVQYLLGDDIVLDVPTTHATPEPLKPKTFYDAIYEDLCRSP